MTVTIQNTEITLTSEDVWYLLTTAFEGGVNYWCEFVRGSHTGDKTKLPDGRNKVVREYEWLAIGGEIELGADGTVHTLTLDLFQKGLQMWIDNNSAKISYDKRRNDNVLNIGVIDANDADNIIQYGVFGELVYS